MKILVTGSSGMLGSDLVRVLSAKYEVFGLGERPNRHSQIPYYQADLTHEEQIKKAFSEIRPAIVIHTAAYTDVDGCELNPDKAFQINAKGTEFIVNASNQNGAVLFLISTDYVFDGTKSSPYTEDDVPNPVSVYGRSKAGAEDYLKAHAHSGWIIRASWLYGQDGKNFFRTLLKMFKSNQAIKIVDDQFGAPTYTQDIACAIGLMIEKASRIQGYRIYHLANGGRASWYDAALRLRELANIQVSIEQLKSNQLNRPAKRPKNSIFSMSKIKKDFGIQLRQWQEALDDFWIHCLCTEWERMTHQKARP